MKTKQEQIEEMGKVIPEKIKDPLDNSRYIIFGKSLRREIARIYYNAGYRKESDAAREILMELLDFVNGWFEGVENNDFGVEFNRISKDVAEKYGVDLGESDNGD